MTAKKENPNRTGRPTKFPAGKNEKEFLEQVERMGKLGFIDTEIAFSLGIATSTLNRWKNKFPDFWEAIKRGKIIADEKVIGSLYKRAIGFKFKELKTEVMIDQATNLPITITDPKTGKSINTAKVIETEKHIAPDTTACIFWTKNRRPQDFKDKHEIQGTLNLGAISMKDLKKSLQEYDQSENESTD